jgi:DNA-binding PadR family transcriptional regulator
MRRRPGSLTPLESVILETAAALAAEGSEEFHGFLLAKQIKDRRKDFLRVAYGPLYKALDRLQAGGLLASRWEESEIAETERRPRRCYFRLTAQGVRALEAAAARNQSSALRPRPA